MKCAIVQDYLRIGGTERQSLFLARHFTEKGDTVSVVTFRPGGHLATPDNLRGLDLHTLQKFDTGLPLLAPGLIDKIRSLDPEVVLCMGRTANCYAGWIQKRCPGTQVVGTLRTGKVIFPLHQWSITRVRAVLVNANWWKRRLLERQFPQDRIHVVHNSLLLEHPDDHRKDLRTAKRSECAIPEDTLVLLNVATFRPGKRHIELLRLFRRFVETHPRLDVRLWLVGDGKEWMHCQRWIRDKGLAPKVQLFHYQHDPSSFYAAADIAVSVSQEDALPNFLIEAQAARLPVLAVHCRGVEETCLHGSTGFVVPPGQPQAFLDALFKLASNSFLRKQFAASARPFAKRRFAPGPQADSIRQFLLSLLK